MWEFLGVFFCVVGVVCVRFLGMCVVILVAVFAWVLCVVFFLCCSFTDKLLLLTNNQ